MGVRRFNDRSLNNAVGRGNRVGIEILGYVSRIRCTEEMPKGSNLDPKRVRGRDVMNDAFRFQATGVVATSRIGKVSRSNGLYISRLIPFDLVAAQARPVNVT